MCAGLEARSDLPEAGVAVERSSHLIGPQSPFPGSEIWEKQMRSADHTIRQSRAGRMKASGWSGSQGHSYQGDEVELRLKLKWPEGYEAAGQEDVQYQGWR